MRLAFISSVTAMTPLRTISVTTGSGRRGLRRVFTIDLFRFGCLVMICRVTVSLPLGWLVGAGFKSAPTDARDKPAHTGNSIAISGDACTSRGHGDSKNKAGTDRSLSRD